MKIFSLSQQTNLFDNSKFNVNFRKKQLNSIGSLVFLNERYLYKE